LKKVFQHPVQKKAGAMVKFKVICPECWAAVITAHPEALVWELCPQCRHHVWDGYDTLMADICPRDPDHPRNSDIHPDN
jgi:hypothetical protein